MYAVKIVVENKDNHVFHKRDTNVRTDYALAHSKEEAMGLGMVTIKAQCPGWGQYDVNVFEIPAEYITEAYKKVVLKEK
jgi:hypothetical protein